MSVCVQMCVYARACPPQEDKGHVTRCLWCCRATAAVAGFGGGPHLWEPQLNETHHSSTQSVALKVPALSLTDGPSLWLFLSPCQSTFQGASAQLIHPPPQASKPPCQCVKPPPYTHTQTHTPPLRYCLCGGLLVEEENIFSCWNQGYWSLKRLPQSEQFGFFSLFLFYRFHCIWRAVIRQLILTVMNRNPLHFLPHETVSASPLCSYHCSLNKNGEEVRHVGLGCSLWSNKVTWPFSPSLTVPHYQSQMEHITHQLQASHWASNLIKMERGDSQGLKQMSVISLSGQASNWDCVASFSKYPDYLER